MAAEAEVKTLKKEKITSKILEGNLTQKMLEGVEANGDMDTLLGFEWEIDDPYNNPGTKVSAQLLHMLCIFGGSESEKALEWLLSNGREGAGYITDLNARLPGKYALPPIFLASDNFVNIAVDGQAATCNFFNKSGIIKSLMDRDVDVWAQAVGDNETAMAVALRRGDVNHTLTFLHELASKDETAEHEAHLNSVMSSVIPLPFLPTIIAKKMWPVLEEAQKSGLNLDTVMVQPTGVNSVSVQPISLLVMEIEKGPLLHVISGLPDVPKGYFYQVAQAVKKSR